MKEAELAYITTSEAGRISLAENYVGLPLWLAKLDEDRTSSLLTMFPLYRGECQSSAYEANCHNFFIEL